MKFRKFLKLVSISTAAALAFSICPVSAAEKDITVRIDNQTIRFDQNPTIYNGRTLVPLRAVFEAVGAEVDWDQDSQTAYLTKDGDTVAVKLGQPYITKNNSPIAIDCPPQLINDRVLIPVRAIAEAMDLGVTWNPIHRSVLISTNGAEYRGNSQWKTGFLPLDDYGFYVNSSFSDLKLDLDGDNSSETIAYTFSDTEESSLIIDGTDFSETVSNWCSAPVAFGLMDIIKSDDYTEIMVVDASSSLLSAYFFRYDGETLSELELAQNDKKGIDFNETLFFDGIENIISDLDGLCFLDTMVCPGIYSLEKDEIKRYYLDCKNSIGNTYTPKYPDNMAFSVYYTSSYISGKYIKNPLITPKVLTPADFTKSIKILDMYMDSSNPANFEFFVEFADGRTAVVYPYNV